VCVCVCVCVCECVYQAAKLQKLVLRALKCSKFILWVEPPHKEYLLELHFAPLAGQCCRRNVRPKAVVTVHLRTFCFQRILTLLNTFQKELRFNSLLACCTPVLIVLTIQQSLFLRAVSFLTRFPALYGAQAFITGIWQPTAGPCSERNESCPRPTTVFNKDPRLIFPCHLRPRLLIYFFPSVLRPNLFVFYYKLGYSYFTGFELISMYLARYRHVRTASVV
jgi:hypothetical protein